MITIKTTGTDTIISTDLTNYHLQRKKGEDEWLSYVGIGFGTGTPEVLTQLKIADYSLDNGFYQYRVKDADNTEAEYEYSDWVKIGNAAEKVGWWFGNYIPPEGKFGDIITPDDMRYHFLWGIDFKASNGQSFTDEQIRYDVQSSVDEIERALNIKLEKTRIKCEPSAEMQRGKDYDEEESAYTYRHDRWQRYGRIILRKRPVIDIQRFEMYSITDQRVIDMKNWIRIDKAKGVISFFPRAGANGSMRVSPASLVTHGMDSYMDYPSGYKIDYICGYDNSTMIPADLRGIIGKIAACKLLNIIGDGLISGFSSSSLSMDGVSESFSSTQSATSAYFGARIKVYLDEIKDYMKANKDKFGFMIMGGI